jgi:hypothetical protein
LYYIKNKNQIINPILLLHIYMKSSKNDYGSHITLWKFIESQMNENLKDNSPLIKAKLFEVEYGQQLTDVLDCFKKAILGEINVNNF